VSRRKQPAREALRVVDVQSPDTASDRPRQRHEALLDLLLNSVSARDRERRRSGRNEAPGSGRSTRAARAWRGPFSTGPGLAQKPGRAGIANNAQARDGPPVEGRHEGAAGAAFGKRRQPPAPQKARRCDPGQQRPEPSGSIEQAGLEKKSAIAQRGRRPTAAASLPGAVETGSESSRAPLAGVVGT
jgi:hypothetical protein